jgi:nicotinic acid mononucleotide adenylyltransferase
MDIDFERIIEIEWLAQHILHEYPKQGPIIEVIKQGNSFNISLIKDQYDHLLVIQGSFDPPLLSHVKLIEGALTIHQSKFPSSSVALVILVSLSHVEKELNILSHSLLGFRVIMIEKLLKELGLTVPWMIGISNVARYIDLTIAIKDFFSEQQIITYVMGTDVFTKLLHQKYYSKPIENILPLIFTTYYLVAGRKAIGTQNDFESFLRDIPFTLQQSQEEKLLFFSLPENLRFLNSTEVRRRLSQDPKTLIASIPSPVMNFLQTTHLYSQRSLIMIKQIIIQICVKWAVTKELKQEICVKNVNGIMNELTQDSQLYSLILDQYRLKTNETVNERCK